jgi:hypothetical protein
MTSPTSPEPLLVYTLGSTPDPIVVSEPGSPATCTLRIVVSCPDPAILPKCQVSGIELDIPVRDPQAPGDATDLASVDPGLAALTYADQDPDRTWTVTRPVPDQYGTFVLIPASTGQKAGTPVVFKEKGVVFTIAGISVTDLVGTATIVICEWAAPGTQSPPSPATSAPTGQVSIPAAKFPSSFQLSGLDAKSLLVEAGETADLRWDGSPTAKYAISYGDINKEPVASTTTHHRWTSGPLVADTEFTLDVSASQDNNTVTAQRKLLIDVSLPQVTSFTADPQSPVAGQKVTLTWRFVRADGVYLKVGNGQQLQFDRQTTSYPLIAGGETDYWLTAYRNIPNGPPVLSSQDHLGVNVLKPQLKSFSAYPTPVDRGEPVKLQWESVNATGVRLQAGGSGKTQDLPAAPDPMNICWGPAGVTEYTMWAYSGEVVSDTRRLTVDFNPVRVDGCSVRFNQMGGNLYLAFAIVAHNATDIEVQIYRKPDDPSYQYPTGKSAAQGAYPDWNTNIQISGFTAAPGFEANFTIYAKGSPRNITVTGRALFHGSGVTTGAYLDAPMNDPNPS